MNLNQFNLRSLIKSSINICYCLFYFKFLHFNHFKCVFVTETICLQAWNKSIIYILIVFLYCAVLFSSIFIFIFNNFKLKINYSILIQSFYFALFSSSFVYYYFERLFLMFCWFIKPEIEREEWDRMIESELISGVYELEEIWVYLFRR